MGGYTGIPLDEGQMTEDIILLLLLVLFVTFAVVFRTNINLFHKMIKDVWQVKERQNLFEDISGNEFFYSNFMTFQALFLSSVSLFSIGRLCGYIPYANLTISLVWLGVIWLLIYILYEFKKILYNLLGFVFVEREKFNQWKTNYHAVIRSWGITLYVPVFLLVFTDTRFIFPIVLFGFLYFLCRFVILYKSIRIFFNKNRRFFYIILYLCGLEILPLAILYRVIVNLYNFIEASAIWH